MRPSQYCHCVKVLLVMPRGLSGRGVRGAGPSSVAWCACTCAALPVSACFCCLLCLLPVMMLERACAFSNLHAVPLDQQPVNVCSISAFLCSLLYRRPLSGQVAASERWQVRWPSHGCARSTASRSVITISTNQGQNIFCGSGCGHLQHRPHARCPSVRKAILACSKGLA